MAHTQIGKKEWPHAFLIRIFRVSLFRFQEDMCKASTSHNDRNSLYFYKQNNDRNCNFSFQDLLINGIQQANEDSLPFFLMYLALPNIAPLEDVTLFSALGKCILLSTDNIGSLAETCIIIIYNNNHSYFTWGTPTDSLVLFQEAQGRCAEENLLARLGIEPATSRLVIMYADHSASAHPQHIPKLTLKDDLEKCPVDVLQTFRYLDCEVSYSSVQFLACRCIHQTLSLPCASHVFWRIAKTKKEKRVKIGNFLSEHVDTAIRSVCKL